jgi:hypothetical protein
MQCAGRKGNQDATPPGGGFLLRLESTTVVCFVGVTGNPVSDVLRLEVESAGRKAPRRALLARDPDHLRIVSNQVATPPGGGFLYPLESTTVVCFVGVTGNPVSDVLRLEVESAGRKAPRRAALTSLGSLGKLGTSFAGDKLRSGQVHPRPSGGEVGGGGDKPSRFGVAIRKWYVRVF